MAAPTKYNPQYHDDWAWSLAMKGATDKDIAEAMHISVKTVQRWSYEWDENDKKVLDANGEPILTSFGEALQTGKEAADAKVERSLYERCVGFDTKEERQTVDVNSDGKSKIGRIDTVKKRVLPDVMAIMYWLNNRSRKTGEWAQKQEVSVSFDDNESGVIIYLPEKERDDNE